MGNPTIFGERLRQLREAAGLTQQALAEVVGCTWESISRWERGTREPGWSQVLALAKALGVSCEAFTQEPTTPSSAEPRKPGRPRKTPANAQYATEEPTDETSTGGATEDTPSPSPRKLPGEKAS